MLQYQLTTADAYACSVPIYDLYGPLHHWQWMASLWRTRVGPDITVYIRECKKDVLEHLKGNLVEVHTNEPRTVVVQKPVGCEGLEAEVLSEGWSCDYGFLGSVIVFLLYITFSTEFYWVLLVHDAN